MESVIQKFENGTGSFIVNFSHDLSGKTGCVTKRLMAVAP